MATVTFSISNVTQGSSWSGSFTVDDVQALVRNDIPTNITVSYNGESTSFTPTQTRLFFASNDSYTTWRTQTTSGQYQTTGKSLDIWSVSLYNDIGPNDFKWTDVITNSQSNPYQLNSAKWTIGYDYDTPYSFAYSYGGTITFNLV